jgi:hypothetical protein
MFYIFLTENATGLTEVKKIEAPVTDLNNLDCENTEGVSDCEEIYYFILGECFRFYTKQLIMKCLNKTQLYVKISMYIRSQLNLATCFDFL